MKIKLTNGTIEIGDIVNRIDYDTKQIDYSVCFVVTGFQKYLDELQPTVVMLDSNALRPYVRSDGMLAKTSFLRPSEIVKNYELSKKNDISYKNYLKKKCSICKLEKSVDHFFGATNNPDGQRDECIKCQKLNEHPKKCNICGKVKSIGQFYKKEGNPDGRRDECMTCQRKQRPLSNTIEPQSQTKEKIPKTFFKIILWFVFLWLNYIFFY